MKYKLVAIPDEPSCRQMELMQKDSVKKNKNLRYLNSISINLGTIDSNDNEKLKIIMDKLIKNMKYFKVNCKEDLSFDESKSTLEALIENKGYIKRLYRILNEYLSLNGFNVSATDFEKDLSVPLLYIPNAKNKKSVPTKPSVDYCKDRFKVYKKPMFTIEKVELRKINESKKDKAIISINLKNF